MAIQTDGVNKDPHDVFIYDSTTYGAIPNKSDKVAIIYGTSSAPTPTGYPDGCIYLQHEA
jgi:hypothetical protein